MYCIKVYIDKSGELLILEDYIKTTVMEAENECRISGWKKMEGDAEWESGCAASYTQNGVQSRRQTRETSIQGNPNQLRNEVPAGSAQSGFPPLHTFTVAFLPKCPWRPSSHAMGSAMLSRGPRISNSDGNARPIQVGSQMGPTANNNKNWVTGLLGFRSSELDWRCL